VIGGGVTGAGAALDAATGIAGLAAGVAARPLVADLNATSPATAAAAAEVLAAAGFDFVDGSISGSPPTVRPGARVYLSGPRAAEVADLRWTHATPVVVGDRVGAASAVKMSTASVYKGLMGLMTQAIRSAGAYDVLERSWPIWARATVRRTRWRWPRRRRTATSPRCTRSPAPRPGRG